MTTNKSVYDLVTEQVLEQLDKGVAPWRKPWISRRDLPRNLESGKAYRGINVWLLMSRSFTSPYWLTFKQALNRGGAVRKGEKGQLVVFWKLVDSKDKETDEVRRVPVLRYYTVFNLEQTDGVKLPAAVIAAQAELESRPHVEPIEIAEAIVAGYADAPRIHHGGEAWYRPSADLVNVPERDDFESGEAYYATLFHELGHSTGHASRLAREAIVKGSFFGSGTYGREELVAEFTAAFLNGEAGIAPATIENSAAYLDNWRRAIQEDPRALVVAAGAAQKSADLILGRIQVEAGQLVEAEVDAPVAEAVAA